MNIIKTLPYNDKWVKRTETVYGVIHHADAIKASFEEVNRWHTEENGWANIGYHFYITKKGEVHEGRPIDVVGAHSYGNNDKSIGICLEGNFILEKIYPLQRLALIDLLNYIIQKYPSIKIVPHRQLNNTSCPGEIGLADILSKLNYEKKNDRLTELENRIEQLDSKLNRIIKVIEARIR